MNERIIFMGTSTFSLEVLKMLIEEKYNIVGVVTQPDRFVGRKKILTMSLVKEEALKYDIPVIQPEKIRQDYNAIIDLKPDLIITAAYGQIVPQAVLDAPTLGCINVHASLLPKYRGGAPVHYAIMNGEKETGVTVMYMVKKMDAGNIIARRSTPIGETETMSVLYDRLSVIGAELLKDTLPSILSKTNESIPQNEEEVIYSPTISREDEKIDWNQSALQIYNKVRGLNSWPGTYTLYNGKVVKIWFGMIHDCPNARVHHANDQNGQIVRIFKDAIGVKTGEGIFLITEIQVEGKKKMSVKDYLNGKNMFIEGTCFE